MTIEVHVLDQDDEYYRKYPENGRIELRDGFRYNMLCSWKNWSICEDYLKAKHYTFHVRLLYDVSGFTTKIDGWSEIKVIDMPLVELLRKRQFMVNVELDWSERYCLVC